MELVYRFHHPLWMSSVHGQQAQELILGDIGFQKSGKVFVGRKLRQYLDGSKAGSHWFEGKPRSAASNFAIAAEAAALPDGEAADVTVVAVVRGHQIVSHFRKRVRIVGYRSHISWIESRIGSVAPIIVLLKTAWLQIKDKAYAQFYIYDAGACTYLLGLTYLSNFIDWRSYFRLE